MALALVRAIASTGSLSLGGVELEQAELAELRRHIVLVEQQAVLVRGTVRENLLLGATGTTDEQLREVLSELGLDGWLAAQRGGLDAPLGGRGTRLSGGQAQRLAIARALLRHPRVLVLDESTSALDAASEQLVLDAIDRRRSHGMAVLLVSHRISILHRADAVLVLQDGQLAETGQPAGLLADPHSLFSQMAVREADYMG